MFGKNRDYKKAKKFILQNTPINAPESVREVYDKYFDYLKEVTSLISAMNEDPVYDNIMTVCIYEDQDCGGTLDLEMFDIASLEARYKDPNAKTIFDLSNITDYMSGFTPKETFRPFEEVGRPICREVLDKFIETGEKFHMALRVSECLVDMYNDGIDREDTKVAWLLSPLPEKDRVIMTGLSHTVDEIPADGLYRAWEIAHKEGLSMEEELESEMLKCEPDTPEAMRIYEEWQELNNEREY